MEIIDWLSINSNKSTIYKTYLDMQGFSILRKIRLDIVIFQLMYWRLAKEDQLTSNNIMRNGSESSRMLCS